VTISGDIFTNNPCRNASRNASRGNGSYDNGVGTDYRAIANRDVPKNSCPGRDKYVVANSGYFMLPAAPPDSYAWGQDHISPNFRPRMDHYAKTPVSNLKALPDLGSERKLTMKQQFTENFNQTRQNRNAV
jgi:hypothetical protein